MALFKAIAGMVKKVNVEVKHEDGTSHFEEESIMTEQQNVQMHPLEEAQILAEWAINQNVTSKMIPEPSRAEEHEWMIEHGVEYVKQKRKEYADDQAMHKPELERHTQLWRDAEKNWHNHVHLCVAHGHNPDTFEGNAADTLTFPPDYVREA